MTIDEAIIQFKEDAEYNRADLDLSWAEENEQVAKWLEELKAIKEGTVFYSNRPIEDIVFEARNDAIDELSKEIHYCLHCGMGKDKSLEHLINLAEKLKEQK